MPRQRLGLHHGAWTAIGARLMALVGLALIWGGAVVLGLAAGLSPGDLQRVSGYETVYRELGRLGPAGWDDTTRALVAAGGLVLFLLLGALGWAQRLIPHRARTGVRLDDVPGGSVTVDPRAVERAAETAAGRGADVHAVRARLDEDTVVVHARDAAGIPTLLRGAQERVQDALRRSGIPHQSVRVLVTRFSSPTTREKLR